MALPHHERARILDGWLFGQGRLSLAAEKEYLFSVDSVWESGMGFAQTLCIAALSVPTLSNATFGQQRQDEPLPTLRTAAPSEFAITPDGNFKFGALSAGFLLEFQFQTELGTSAKLRRSLSASDALQLSGQEWRPVTFAAGDDRPNAVEVVLFSVSDPQKYCSLGVFDISTTPPTAQAAPAVAPNSRSPFLMLVGPGALVVASAVIVIASKYRARESETVTNNQPNS